jgi:hypothetical protein
LPSVFYGSTWSEFQLMTYHFFKKSATEWDHTRTIMSYILNTQATKKSQQKTPQQIIKLWTDKQAAKVGEQMTEQQKKAFLEGITGKRDGKQ